MAAPTAFFTGFPGFLGTRLVRRLLSEDRELRVVALVEERMAELAREVAAEIEAARADAARTTASRASR